MFYKVNFSPAVDAKIPSQMWSLTFSAQARLPMPIGLKESCWKYVGWCDECPYNGVDDEHDNCSCTIQEKIDSLARELGIEVEA
jgi:hypothetical protein